MTSPADLARPHVRALHAYTPGLQPTEPGWIKLNTNENPYPPSPRVEIAIRAELGDALRLYPSPTSAPLRAAAAKRHRLAPENVCIGNGSDDLLNLLVRCFAGPDRSAGFTLPSYSLYPVLVGIENGRTTEVPFDRSMRLPVEAIAESHASIFFLTSPNAPTGVGFRTEELQEIARRFRGLLVIDEAYADFAEENAAGLVERHANVCVVRTLSKSYSLAGLRVGYALAHPEIIGLLDRVRDSYNVGRLAQVGALAALEDQGYYAALTQKVKATRDYYRHELESVRGWFTYPSATNFLFTEPRRSDGDVGPEVAADLYEFLRSRKILVRYFGSHALTRNFLRISVGTDDDMLAVSQSLDAWQTRA